jgi:hypothetical protein
VSLWLNKTDKAGEWEMKNHICIISIFILLGCVPKKQAVLLTYDLKQLAEANPKSARYMEESPMGGPAMHLKPGSMEGVISLYNKSEKSAWDEANFVVADVWHDNRYSAILHFRFFDSDTAKQPRISSKMGILPKLKTRVVLPLSYLDGQTFFMARQERRLKGVMPGRRLDQEKIAAVTFGLEPVQENFQTQVWVSNLRLMKEKPEPLPPSSETIVDSLGQWKTRAWTGKTVNSDDLRRKMNRLYQEAKEAAYPDNWSQYGGWKKKKLTKGSGFFSVHHDGNRWWLVDPLGYAFFSIGIDCMNPSSSGPVSGMEDLHEWLPPSEGPFADAISERRRWKTCSFLTANLIRVFGDQWEARWQEMSRGLMLQWRFNTIGNWSDRNFIQNARMPYVLPLSRFPSTDIKLYRDFPDVFSEDFKAAADSFAQQMNAYKDDPYLIGYFLRNEPLWAFGDNNIASEMLATETPSASRNALTVWLEKRYHGQVNAFAEAWNISCDSFDELKSKAIPDAAALSEKAEADLREFSAIMVEQYLKYPSEALRKVASNHMNLGIRYGWISSDLCFIGTDYFDVFSINSYSEKPDPAIIKKITDKANMPVMIGEFHHGSIDRGLPSTGIGGVESQEERGTSYSYYVEQGAMLPGLVGIHYFQLNDQPVLGRFDGENYNIGLVDICNMPYDDMLQSVIKTNEQIYEVVSGKKQATSIRAKMIPKIYF